MKNSVRSIPAKFFAALLFIIPFSMNAQFSVSSTNETCHNSGNGTVRIINQQSNPFMINLSGDNNYTYRSVVIAADTTITGLAAGNYSLNLVYAVESSNAASASNSTSDSLSSNTVQAGSTGNDSTYSNAIPANTPTNDSSITITITTPDAVIADFNPSTTVADGSAPVFFSNASSGADSYTWNFGDGNTASSLDASHSFNATGNYTVTLTATNTNGCTSSHTDVVSVTPPSAPSNYFMSRENLAGDGPGMARMSHTNFNTSATPGSILINNTGDVDGDYSVTVMNMNGQIFATQQTNNSNITLSVDGGQIYLVYITSPDGTTTSEKIYVSK